MSQIPEVAPAPNTGDFPEGFPEICVNALSRLLEEGEQVDLMNRFVAVYRFRSQYPWLGEGEARFDVPTGYGFSFAIASALGRYRPEEFDSNLADVRPSEPAAEKESWELALLQLPHWSLGLTSFEDVVVEAGVRHEEMTEQAVSPHILRAIKQYVEHPDAGLDGDPW